MAEIEAKFLVQQEESLAQLVSRVHSEFVVRPLPTLKVVDRYFDTPDWRVFRAGWAYRWRSESGKRLVCLKSIAWNAGCIIRREEVEQQVATFPKKGSRIPRGCVARQLRTIGQKQLQELFVVHNRRQCYEVRTASDATIEMAIDRVEIKAVKRPKKSAPRRLEFVELELELKQGSERGLQELIELIREGFGLLPAKSSKFGRGLRTLGLSPPASLMTPDARLLEQANPVRGLRSSRLGIKTPVFKLAYHCLLEDFEQMLAAQSTAWEGLDTEGVHQMRVATRRIRGALRAFKNVLPASGHDSFSREFKWVAAMLGAVRDLDVYRDNLSRYVGSLAHEDVAHLTAYHQHLELQWLAARTELLSCLSSSRYAKLKDNFVEFLRRGLSEPELGKLGEMSVRIAAKKFVGKQYSRVLRDGRSIMPNSTGEAIHALRIDCKRLRYLLEFFGPVVGRSRSSLIGPLKDLQNVLGEFQDACVAIHRLRDYAENLPMQRENKGVLIAIGALISARGLQRAKKRKAFAKVWRQFDEKGHRKRILAILDP